jgi:hypothetical protein
MLYLFIILALVIGTIAYSMITAPMDPNEEQYKATYIVYYKPPISKEGKDAIKRNLEPNMSSNDNDSQIYSISRIFVIDKMLSVSDLSFLKRLEDRGIDYVEL